MEAYVIGAALLTAAVAAVLLVQMSRKAKDSPSPPAGPLASADASADPSAAQDDALLLKFVRDADGTKRGETVAFAEGQVVVKAPEGFYLVASDRLHLEGEEVIASGDVDWPQARERGEAWRETHHKVMDEGAPDAVVDEGPPRGPG